MAWIYLFLAGLLEVVWAVGLKYSENFTKIFPTIITLVGMLLSIIFLNFSLKTIPLGTAYAVWTGIGIMGTIIFGVVCFGETVSIMKAIFFLLILIGIMGLKILT